MDSISEYHTIGTGTELCTSYDSDDSMSSSGILDSYDDPDDERVGLPGLIIVWILTSATIFGNCLVLFSFAINRKIRSKPANVFILTLSLADLTIGVVSLPLNNLYLQYGYWAFGEILCISYLFLDYTACSVSVGCIILLSLDRYWMVKKHLSYNAFMTHRKAIALTLSSVLFSCIFNTLTILSWNFITENESNMNYIKQCNKEGIENKALIYSWITIVFVLPLALLVHLNVNVYIEVVNWSSGKDLQSEENFKNERKKAKEAYKTEISMRNPNLDQKNAKSDNKTVKQSSFRRFQGARRGSQTRKAAITLAALVTVFIICWLPYNIFTIKMATSKSFSNLVWTIVTYLLWINSGINPIVYAFMNKEFRKTFAKIMLLIIKKCSHCLKI